MLLEDKALDKDAVLIGERAHSVKVPAATDDRRLPPVAWEESRLPVNRALVLVNVRRAGGAAGRVLVRGLRGTLPAPPLRSLRSSGSSSGCRRRHARGMRSGLSGWLCARWLASCSYQNLRRTICGRWRW